MSGNKKYYNLKNATLEELKIFYFNHKNHPDLDPWEWNYLKNIKVDFDPILQSNLFIRMFKNSAQLIDEFNIDQLEFGFWNIPFGQGGSLYTLIYDGYFSEYPLSIEIKEKLIYSIFDLYNNLFRVDPLLERACYMWWDSLAYSFSPGLSRSPETNEEDKRIQEAMFKTLKKILYLDSLDCQIAAAHGINHLHHPETKAILTQYLNDHPDIDAETRRYVTGCMSGESM